MVGSVRICSNAPIIDGAPISPERAWSIYEHWFHQSEVGHLLDAPVEVRRQDAVPVHVRRGVREVDRVRDAVLHGELDRVHVVAERVVERPGVIEDLLLHLLQEH